MSTADLLATVGEHAFKPYCVLDIQGIRRRLGTVIPAWASAIADTIPNRPIRPYMLKVPEMSGQRAEPLDGNAEFSSATFEVSDVGEELTDLLSMWDDSSGLTTLYGDADKAAATIDVADSSSLASGINIYVQRETMKITAINVGAGADGTDELEVDRGQYGSADADHHVTDAQGNTRSISVHGNPPYVLTRDVTLYLGVVGLLEADMTILQRGYIENVRETSPGTWQISISGQLRRLSCQIGETLHSTTLSTPLWGSDLSWIYPVAPPGKMHYFHTWLIWLLSGTVIDFEDSGVVQIDDELIRYVAKSANGGFLKLVNYPDADIHEKPLITAGRGLLSEEILGTQFRPLMSTPDGEDVAFIIPWPGFQTWHDFGAKIQECITHFAFDNTDPISILLEFLTSTGDGTNGNYDTLPKGWGAGIDDSLIDIAGLERLRDNYFGDLSLRFFINEPTDLLEWLTDNILRPCLIFPVETADGTISFKRLLSEKEAADLAAADVLTVDETVLNWPPVFDVGKPPIGDIAIGINYYPPHDEFYGKIQCLLSDGLERYEGRARAFDLECKTVYDRSVKNGRRGFLSDDMGGMPAFLSQLMEPIWERFALNPCPIVSFELDLSYMPRAKVGDIIKITCSVSPDLKEAGRGITNQYIQVIEERPMLSDGVLEIIGWYIGVHNGPYRKIAPAGKVKTYVVDGGVGGKPRISFEDDIFSDGDVYGYDAEPFSKSDVIAFVDADFVALDGAGIPETATIGLVGDNYIDLTAVPTDAPGAGDYVILAKYASCTATQQAEWAFLADATPDLDGDDPHRRST